jgi:predicted aspartyl protease
LLGAASPLSAQAPGIHLQTVNEAQPIDRTTQTDDVRMKNDIDDRMTVPVMLSGSGPYRFLVDTGADRTAVSRQIADRLQLTRQAKVVLHSVTGATSVETAKVPILDLDRKRVHEIDAALLDGAHMGADGILGVDSLASQRVMFDFEKNTMSVVPSSAPDFKREPGTIVVVGKRRQGRLLFTEASINGRRVVVVIDTGSAVSLGNEALRRQLQGTRHVTTKDQVELMSVTGDKILGDYTFVRVLEVGGVKLNDLAIIFTDAHTFRQLDLENRPALLLGMNAIRAFKKVSIDFANRKFRVLLPEQSQLETRLALKGAL